MPSLATLSKIVTLLFDILYSFLSFFILIFIILQQTFIILCIVILCPH